MGAEEHYDTSSKYIKPSSTFFEKITHSFAHNPSFRYSNTLRCFYLHLLLCIYQLGILMLVSSLVFLKHVVVYFFTTFPCVLSMLF
ncbi:uncharacterized protein DS421_13g400760 [Arachis hypogaea]|nr:uncharacterized protein DS421_13g400760 [Arachis hypogaea]